MSKLTKSEVIKHKKIAFSTLILMFMAYIVFNYFHNAHLINNGMEADFDFSFPILSVAILMVTAMVFRLIERMVDN